MSLKQLFLLLLCSILPLSAQDLFSATTNGEGWIGHVGVKRDSKKVTVHKTYLEIEEEVELFAKTTTSSGEPSQDGKRNLEIYGNFYLPRNSVITGAVLWNGDQLLKAKLKALLDAEDTYQETVDHDWNGQKSPSDPMLIELVARNVPDRGDKYEFHLFPVSKGETRRLRIRYLLPLQYVNNIPTMTIPHIFAQAVGGDQSYRPDTYTLDLKGSEGVDSVKLTDQGSDKTYLLTTPQSGIPKPYNNFDLLRIEHPNFDSTGFITKTSIDTGKLAGEYLHYFSNIPEKLLLEIGLKREVIFLWRWENEDSFVKWENQEKQFTSFGFKALEQANDIKHLTEYLLSGRAGVGMIHQRSSDYKDTTFSLAYKSTPQADSLLNYLEFLAKDEGENIKAEISGNANQSRARAFTDTLPAKVIDSLALEGKEEFEIAIESIETIFSEDKNAIKHVIVITVGKRKYDNKLFWDVDLNSIPDVTFSCHGTDEVYPHGFWPGVDLARIHNDRYLINGEVVSDYRIPETEIINFKVTLTSSTREKSYEIPGKINGEIRYFDHVYFTGHAEDIWYDSIIWEAQDSKGNRFPTVTQYPEVVKNQNDTDIVMLWGGSSSAPYSEKFNSGSIGVKVGFVDESYSLITLNEDTVSQEIKKAIEDGGDIPNLTEDEIFEGINDPVSNISQSFVAKEMSKGFHSITPYGSGLKISLNIGTAQYAELIIYDLKGRIIMRFSREQLLGNTEIFWDGTGPAGVRTASGMYIARLSMDSYSKSIKFIR